MMNKPTATIVFGSPVSGKSTFLACLYKANVVQSPYVTMEELQDIVQKKSNFTLETDMNTGEEMETLAMKLKENGYFIRLFEVRTGDSALNASYLYDRLRKDRIASYDVMMNIIEADHNSSFGEYMFKHCDETYLIDNGERNDKPVLAVAYSFGVPALVRKKSEIGRKSPSLSFYEAARGFDDEEKEIVSNPEIEKNSLRIEQAIEYFFPRAIQRNQEWLMELMKPYELGDGEIIAYLVSTTNHGLAHYRNIFGLLRITTYARWIGDWRDETFHTSALKGYELDGSRLTLYTLNSTYVFEIVAGEFDEFAFTRANQELIDSQDQRNNTKHDAYWCQIASGFAMIDGAINVAVLPYPMTLQEARDHLLDNMLTDNEGNIVTNIMQAYEKKEKKQ